MTLIKSVLMLSLALVLATQVKSNFSKFNRYIIAPSGYSLKFVNMVTGDLRQTTEDNRQVSKLEANCIYPSAEVDKTEVRIVISIYSKDSYHIYSRIEPGKPFYTDAPGGFLATYTPPNKVSITWTRGGWIRHFLAQCTVTHMKTGRTENFLHSRTIYTFTR
ncbi:hypothetical protein EGW08_023351 [Elysia chlorotica]|uniref:Uncharacterized protein n=1 Tax=Elysia chlorotica TaxID=188477 RepID=A0A3S1AW54_ELYCH|nr:hypothetical protein EGW08_023351 [Elysia chlorotica]